MRNRMHGGVRGRKTKVGRKLLRFPPTRLFLRKQCVNKLFEFGVWNVFVSANANIVQRVKTCYKNKIDYRESSGGFCRIMQG